ncbi:MAG: IclR family transcriptional regulator [Mesorhizobium sp.]
MRVRQVDKALDLFELFAQDRNAMTLTAIARELDIPKSSAFNLIETLTIRGYLHQARPRGGYYPTLRLADLARAIVGEDLLIQRIHPDLEELAEETGETALLALREHNEIVYIDVVESKAPIRYPARVGERRPLHTTSSGKAILVSYDERDRRAIIDTFGLLLAAADRLTTELEAIAQRGWTEDAGETLSDVTGFGTPIAAGRWRLGLAVAGPAYRMQPARDRIIGALVARGRRIVGEISVEL